MTGTVTVAISLPVNGTPFDRVQALIAAMHNPATGTLGGMAIAQLLGDVRVSVESGIYPRLEIRLFGD